MTNSKKRKKEIDKFKKTTDKTEGDVQKEMRDRKGANTTGEKPIWVEPRNHIETVIWRECIAIYRNEVMISQLI